MDRLVRVSSGFAAVPSGFVALWLCGAYWEWHAAQRPSQCIRRTLVEQAKQATHREHARLAKLARDAAAAGIQLPDTPHSRAAQAAGTLTDLPPAPQPTPARMAELASGLNVAKKRGAVASRVAL